MKPSTPRAAASLILLRHGGRHGARAIEVLLVRRSPESSFMPGVWVFPGGVVEPDDVAAEAQGGTTEAERSDLAHRACAARELGEEAGIELPAHAELRPWSRWITPEGAPVRFDTRFYVTLAPPHSRAQPDGAETTEADLDLAGRGSGTPSRRTSCLSSSRRSSTWSRSCRTRAPTRCSRRLATDAIEPVVPRVVGEGEAARVVLPGEPGY